MPELPPEVRRPASGARSFLIGVTGDIASGKTSVLALLAERGAETIDADRVYHELIRGGSPLRLAIAAHFGADIAVADGEIDRRKLGAIVFADPEKLSELERITHPAVLAEIERRIARSSAAVVAVDAVKLFEGSLARRCDRIWLVVCASEVQLARLMTRNTLSREEAERRMAAQPPRGDKVARSDVVIDNSGSPAEMRDQVAAAWAAAFAEAPSVRRSPTVSPAAEAAFMEEGSRD